MLLISKYPGLSNENMHNGIFVKINNVMQFDVVAFNNWIQSINQTVDIWLVNEF